MAVENIEAPVEEVMAASEDVLPDVSSESTEMAVENTVEETTSGGDERQENMATDMTSSDGLVEQAPAGTEAETVIDTQSEEIVAEETGSEQESAAPAPVIVTEAPSEGGFLDIAAFSGRFDV